MQFSDNFLTQLVSVLNEVHQIINALIMSLYIKVVFERFAFGRQTFHQESDGLAISQGVPFNSIRVVIPVEPEFLHDATFLLRRERAQRSYLRFALVNSLQ